MGLLEPECMKQGYVYVGDDGERRIKEDAPDWAKEEFKEFLRKVNPKPDKKGIITRY